MPQWVFDPPFPSWCHSKLKCNVETEIHVELKWLWSWTSSEAEVPLKFWSCNQIPEMRSKPSEHPSAAQPDLKFRCHLKFQMTKRKWSTNDPLAVESLRLDNLAVLNYFCAQDSKNWSSMNANASWIFFLRSPGCKQTNEFNFRVWNSSSRRRIAVRHHACWALNDWIKKH